MSDGASAESLPLSLEQRLDDVCQRLENAWATGQRQAPPRPRWQRW
jgi:hypothetical protein